MEVHEMFEHSYIEEYQVTGNMQDKFTVQSEDVELLVLLKTQKYVRQRVNKLCYEIVEQLAYLTEGLKLFYIDTLNEIRAELKEVHQQIFIIFVKSGKTDETLDELVNDHQDNYDDKIVFLRSKLRSSSVSSNNSHSSIIPHNKIYMPTSDTNVVTDNYSYNNLYTNTLSTEKDSSSCAVRFDTSTKNLKDLEHVEEINVTECFVDSRFCFNNYKIYDYQSLTVLADGPNLYEDSEIAHDSLNVTSKNTIAVQSKPKVVKSGNLVNDCTEIRRDDSVKMLIPMNCYNQLEDICYRTEIRTKENNFKSAYSDTIFSKPMYSISETVEERAYSAYASCICGKSKYNINYSSAELAYFAYANGISDEPEYCMNDTFEELAYFAYADDIFRKRKSSIVGSFKVFDRGRKKYSTGQTFKVFDRGKLQAPELITDSIMLTSKVIQVIIIICSFTIFGRFMFYYLYSLIFQIIIALIWLYLQ